MDFTVIKTKWFLMAILLAALMFIVIIIPVVLLSGSLKGTFFPTLKWWQTTIIYQVYPRSFQDTNNDGTGDIEGITQRLDYFTYLNVKAIWLSPFFPSPMQDFGYDISNYTDVDPLFGNLSQFDEMLSKAHSKGIRVMMDFVPGHTSSDHPWFKLSVNKTQPYEDYYIWANGTILPDGNITVPSNWMSVFGYSAWEWHPVREQYYYHAFGSYQPTLNYRNPLVVKEMQDVLRFWLDRGIDGIRVDAVAFIMVHKNYYENQSQSYANETEWWQNEYYVNNLTTHQPEIADIVKGWREVLDSYVGSNAEKDNSKFMIIEVYAEPQVRNLYYGYGADMPFNFDLVSSLNSRHSCDAICLRDVIQKQYDSLPTGKWTNFVLSNHDNNRVTSRIGTAYTDALLILLLTLRGTPTHYYGEEIGMEDIFVSYNDTQDPFGKQYGPGRYEEVSRDPERSPMQWSDGINAGFTNSTKPWLPVHPNYQVVNVETEKNSKSMTTLQMFQTLATLREQPSLQYGTLGFAVVTPGILSYLRFALQRASYLVVMNLGNSTETKDFSVSPIDRGVGDVKAVTPRAANEGRFVKDARITLTQITLQPGDGLVIQLP